MPSVAQSVLAGINTGVAVKPPCVAVSTVNLTLSGEQTVGGVACTDGDRVLVRAQTDTTENGIYDCSTGQWQRSLDFDGNNDVVKGTLVLTSDTAGIAYFVSSPTPIIDTDPISFTASTLVVTSGTVNALLTQAGVGAALNPISSLETGASVTPSDYAYPVLARARYATAANWSAVYNRVATVGTLAATYDIAYRVDHALHPSITNSIVGWGSYNDSLMTGTLGYRNTVMGVQALAGNSASTLAGGSNCAFGFQSQQMSVDTSGNCTFGTETGKVMTGVVSAHNNAFGHQGLNQLTSGTQNNAFGYRALFSITSGNNNTAIGESTLQTITSGSQNTAIGMQALYSKTSGSDSTAVGAQALFSETTAVGNTAVGNKAGFSIVSAGGNSIFGYLAASAAALGINNSIFGYEAGKAINAGTYNACFGYWAGLAITSGGSNCLFGQQSGKAITTASENICIGPNSGVSIVATDRSVFVGSTSGNNLNGANNTGCGYNAGSTGAAQTYTNTGNFGANAVPNASDRITFGDGSITQLRAQVTTITALSDIRYKSNVVSIDRKFASRVIRDARMVTHLWDNSKSLRDANGDVAIDEDGRDFPEGTQLGVIAQEFVALQKKHGFDWGLVDTSNPNRFEATPGKLLFPLVASHQDLFGLHEALDARFGKLSDSVNALRVDHEQLAKKLAKENAALKRRVVALEKAA